MTCKMSKFVAERPIHLLQNVQKCCKTSNSRGSRSRALLQNVQKCCKTSNSCVRSRGCVAKCPEVLQNVQFTREGVTWLCCIMSRNVAKCPGRCRRNKTCDIQLTYQPATLPGICFVRFCIFDIFRCSYLMDRFLLKRSIPSSSQSPPTKRSKSSAKQGRISAAQRVREYGKDKFNESGGKLFCRACNVVIDHVRKFVLDRYLQSKVCYLN